MNKTLFAMIMCAACSLPGNAQAADVGPFIRAFYPDARLEPVVYLPGPAPIVRTVVTQSAPTVTMSAPTVATVQQAPLQAVAVMAPVAQVVGQTLVQSPPVVQSVTVAPAAQVVAPTVTTVMPAGQVIVPSVTTVAPGSMVAPVVGVVAPTVATVAPAVTPNGQVIPSVPVVSVAPGVSSPLTPNLVTGPAVPGAVVTPGTLGAPMAPAPAAPAAPQGMLDSLEQVPQAAPAQQNNGGPQTNAAPSAASQLSGAFAAAGGAFTAPASAQVAPVVTMAPAGQMVVTQPAPVAQPLVRPAISSMIGAPVAASRQPSSQGPRTLRFGAPPVSPILPTATMLGSPAEATFALAPAVTAAVALPIATAVTGPLTATITPSIATATTVVTPVMNPYANMNGPMYKHPAFPGKLLYFNKVTGRWVYQSDASASGWAYVPMEWNPGPAPIE